MGRLLNTKQRKRLEKQQKKEKLKREADRLRAVLSYDDGKTPSAIAEILYVDESTIRSWIKKYEKDGSDGLTRQNHKGKEPRLSEKQEEQLKCELKSTLYQRTREIIQFVHERFGVQFSTSGMTKLLHRLGFSYKKPKGVPAKAKPEEQLRFLRVLRGIVPHGLVFFGDSTHPTLNPVLTSGWIEKGTEFEVKTGSGRQRVNVNGAIEINTLQTVVRTCKSVNESSILELLRSIRRKNPIEDKIYLVLDNASYNKTKRVKVLATELGIRLHYLPPYSPNLNPIERLWKFMKSQILANKSYEDLSDFKAAVSSFFRGIRKYEDELRSLLTTNFRLIEN